MTLDEAVAIREKQLQRLPVRAADLQEALYTIQANNPKKVGRPYKFRLPRLTQEQRDRMNGTLLLNLGMNLRRESV